MKTLQYIFDRDAMQDPFDRNVVWRRLDVHTLTDEHAARLLRHSDCWVAVDAALGDPEPVSKPVKDVSQKEQEEKEVEEIEERIHELLVRLPRLESASKSTLIQFAKREFNQDLDPQMKPQEMRDRIKQLANNTRVR